MNSGRYGTAIEQIKQRKTRDISHLCKVRETIFLHQLGPTHRPKCLRSPALRAKATPIKAPGVHYCSSLWIEKNKQMYKIKCMTYVLGIYENDGFIQFFTLVGTFYTNIHYLVNLHHRYHFTTEN